jgi:photosystem II stability/assembly factor-like uncharacterized protein
MKKIIFIIPLLFVMNDQISAQWIVQNSGVSEYLKDVFFVNEFEGWVCGYDGMLLKTEDGGLNWEQINLGFNNYFYSIYFINDNIGWLIGNGGLILKTVNRGLQWEQQNLNTSDDLLSDVFFVDENNGWITTGNQVLKTTDGGNSWTSYPNGLFLGHAIYFTNTNNGWVCDVNSDLSRTTDGGINWTLQSSGTNRSRSDIFFVNENIGWTFGNTITKTIDGGNSWFVLYSFNSAVWINSGFFLDENTGWVCGTESDGYGSVGKIFKTTNGGNSWLEEFSQYGTPLYKIFFVDNVNGWVTGMNGFIAKYDISKYIQVTAPNGGEHWLAGSSYDITWQKNNVELMNLLYSTDNGLNWILIADNINADNLGYYWDTIPNTPSENCIIKIIDVEDPNIYDLSDNTFSIIFNPQIIVDLPNGNESISRGSIFHIIWTSQQVNSVNILLSLNSGINWQPVFSNYNYGGNIGEYNWNVPDTTSEQCLVKIESSIDNSIFDVSDNNFRIISTPRFSYFPLSIGNKWFFSYGHDQVIHYKLEVEKDTILDDGYSYAKLNYYWKNNEVNFELNTEGYAYLREDSGKILKYPNRILINYQMNIGDTVASHSVYPISAVLDTFLLEKVFNRYLSTYYFFDNPPFDYYTYTDSIGFNTLRADTWHNYLPQYLLGCIIDNISYGTITEVEDESKIPYEFLLSQNYPNPFNPTTTITYQVSRTGFVSLKVYDLLGREIAILINEEKPAGNYEIEFDGSSLTSGIYFYKLQTRNYTSVKKMILLR